MEFRFKEVKIVIKKGDIAQEDAQALVNPANTSLSMGGGVALALREKGGRIIEEEALSKAPIRKGDVVFTSAGRLKCRFIIHAATMDMDFKTDEETIRKATRNTLLEAKRLKVRSLSFPALGCGTGKFPYSACSKIMAQEVFKFVHFDTPGRLKEIRFVLRSKKAFNIFEDIVYNYITYIYEKIQKGPFLTVDGIVPFGRKILLIERKNPPFGWALPGGFVDWGETVEEAVKREVEEETGIKAKSLDFFGVYSNPQRDPRFHTVSCVYVIRPLNRNFKASSDAKNIGLFSRRDIKRLHLAFDHRNILEDFFSKNPLKP